MKSITVGDHLKWIGFNFTIVILSFCYAMTLKGKTFVLLAFYTVWLWSFLIEFLKDRLASFSLFIYCVSATIGTFFIYFVIFNIFRMR